MLPTRTYARFARRTVQYWTGQRLPFWVSWFINSECQIRCGGCFFFSRQFSFGEPLDTAGRFALLDQLIALKQPFLTLLGGEPFQCPDLFPLAIKAREAGIFVEVTTNGLDIEEPDLERVEGAFDRFWVSIDGPREAHDQGRGPGTWDRAMNTLRGVLARRRRGQVGVSTVLSSRNVETMAGFLREIRDLGVDQICLKDNLIPELRADPAATRRALDDILAIKRETPAYIQQEEEFLLRLVDLRETSHAACQLAEHFHVSLLPDGTVSACVSFPVPIGNALEQPLTEILKPGPPERYAAGITECPGCTRNDVLLFQRFLKRPWSVLSPRQFRKLLYT